MKAGKNEKEEDLVKSSGSYSNTKINSKYFLFDEQNCEEFTYEDFHLIYHATNLRYTRMRDYLN